ncbi:hypothetical protein LTR66_001677 [Elasticomyces elasticus]|nr:hypothetical protein LTR50_000717 [Elasticomyces elasticus]KAK4999251.1 hypothetical protein LTR66_001677 [Elasticomyces elasticus]
MEDFHVLIVGAGITGLLLAQALKKASIPYTIFEAEVSATAYRPRQWGLSIHWSYPLLRKILPQELFDRLQEAQCDPYYTNPDVENLNIYNGSTGEQMTVMPEPHHRRFNRARMRAFCSQGIDVQYSKKLASISYPTPDTVRVHFEDSTSATGTLLVGADGTHSRIRRQLLGPEKGAATSASTAEESFVFTNTMVRYPNPEQARFVRALHPVFYMGLHPEGGLFWVSPQDVPDPQDPTSWTFQLFMNWRGQAPADGTNILPELKAWAPKLVDPWKSAIEWLPDDTIVQAQKIGYWMPIPRDNIGGRVTLAGDAAHPMAPFRGQGLSHCIADVSSLLSQLELFITGSGSSPKPTLAELITAYDSEVIARAGDEVQTSLQTMRFLMTWDKVQQSASFTRSADPNAAALKILAAKT